MVDPWVQIVVRANSFGQQSHCHCGEAVAVAVAVEWTHSVEVERLGFL
jgi:hypothetical protein